jgi:hypothetical protein
MRDLRTHRRNWIDMRLGTLAPLVLLVVALMVSIRPALAGAPATQPSVAVDCTPTATSLGRVATSTNPITTSCILRLSAISGTSLSGDAIIDAWIQDQNATFAGGKANLGACTVTNSPSSTLTVPSGPTLTCPGVTAGVPAGGGPCTNGGGGGAVGGNGISLICTLPPITVTGATSLTMSLSLQTGPPTSGFMSIPSAAAGFTDSSGTLNIATPSDACTTVQCRISAAGNPIVCPGCFPQVNPASLFATATPTPAPDFPTHPLISADPSAMPGDIVTVVGDYFPPPAPGRNFRMLTLNPPGDYVGHGASPSGYDLGGGDFSGFVGSVFHFLEQVIIPSGTPPGPYTLTAELGSDTSDPSALVGSRLTVYAQTSITIIAPPSAGQAATPTLSVVGSQTSSPNLAQETAFTVGGKDFVAFGQVQIFLDTAGGTPLATTTADSDGLIRSP